ncbi:hypothetical protein HMPREF9166_0857 [Selenomonas sp. oral taxon 149 str. 67H29BP]|nr:hypothetical protein HMPREF9166_0857 [Selenomonas sp. oral taxon 149 str. 67H29BP]
MKYNIKESLKKEVRQIGIDFSFERGGKPEAEWCSVENFPPKCGQKDASR